MTEVKAGPANGGRRNYVGRRESIFTRRLTSRLFPSFDIPTVKPYNHYKRVVIVSSTLMVLGTTGSRKIEAETLRPFALTSSTQVFPSSRKIRTPSANLPTPSTSTYAPKADLIPRSTRVILQKERRANAPRRGQAL